jgi:hypothetical protein
MTAGQIATKPAASHEYFPAVIRQRHNSNVGSAEPSNRRVIREQHGLASRQDLRPAVGGCSVL